MPKATASKVRKTIGNSKTELNKTKRKTKHMRIQRWICSMRGAHCQHKRHKTKRKTTAKLKTQRYTERALGNKHGKTRNDNKKPKHAVTRNGPLANKHGKWKWQSCRISEGTWQDRTRLCGLVWPDLTKPKSDTWAACSVWPQQKKIVVIEHQ